MADKSHLWKYVLKMANITFIDSLNEVYYTQ